MTLRTSALVVLLSLALPGLASASDVCGSRSEEQKAQVDRELLAYWKADKEDRENQNPDTRKNDARRIKAVSKLVEKGWICSPLNAFHAAWVLQRSPEPGHARTAHALAKRAMDARIQNGEWLAAVTFDILQIRYGRPQRYGTQMTTLPSGELCLYPVDVMATDDERAQYRIRPLAETFRQVLDLNNLHGVPATRESLDLEKLWCPPQNPPAE